MSKRHTFYFISVFLILLIGRLWIAGTGYLEDQDEFLYIWMHMHFADFLHADTWTRCINDMQGQPPEIATRLVEYITTLPIAAALGKSVLHPDVLYFIGLYNIIVSLLILYVFYRILLKLDFSVMLALTGTLVLGTLFNFNMYTRHILPYDQSLLFQLLALNLLLRDQLSPRTILLAGLLSAIGLTNYMGSFTFIFINGGLLIFPYYKEPKVVLKNVLLFTLPFILLVSFYEIFTRMNGSSYLQFIGDYYHTIDSEGSNNEGLTFLFKYFYLVEKWWGLVLLLLFFAGSYLLFKKGTSVKSKHVLLLGILSYLSFGMYIVFFQKMVFEGRILHIYYPFIIIGVMAWLKQQNLWPADRLAIAVIFFACLNYGFVIKDFNSIGYPRNAIYKFHLFEEKGKVDFSFYAEMSPAVHYSQRSKYYIDSVGARILPPGHYLAINVCFLPHFPDSLLKSYKPWRKAETDSIVFEQPDFQSHPAYTLEYCSQYGREFYLKNQLKIRVVKRKVAQ